jgi:hypothetical protein
VVLDLSVHSQTDYRYACKTIMNDPSDVQARVLARGPWRVPVQSADDV